MRVKLNALTLYCVNGIETVDFGDVVSFFHGEFATGKSSIANLVYYAFGGGFRGTEALRKELLKVRLDCELGQFDVALERNVSPKSYVDAFWSLEGEVYHTTLSVAGTTESGTTSETVNLSDFILKCVGYPRLRRRISKKDSVPRYERLSFKDIFTFLYLDQLEMDSNFFYLKSGPRTEKSRDVLRYVLRLFTERYQELEAELAENLKERRTLVESANALAEFLKGYGYNSSSEIDEEISKLEESVEELRNKLNQDSVSRGYTHTVSEEKNDRRRSLDQEISKARSSLQDLDGRLREQRSLRSEFVTLKMKGGRQRAATGLLERAAFEMCPACGSDIVRRGISKDQCYLCKNYLETESDAIGEVETAFSNDLTERVKELDESIKRLEVACERVNERLSRLVAVRNELLEEVETVDKSTESEYIQRVRDIEAHIGSYQERARMLRDLKRMPEEVERKRREVDVIDEEIERVRALIEEEDEQMSEGQENLRCMEQKFKSILLGMKFPGVNENTEIRIDSRTFSPFVLPNGDATQRWRFEDAGSGGKSVLFKMAFALALHCTAAERELPLPHILIIDSTMKNLDTNVNYRTFEAFYKELYYRIKFELKDWQVILIDQTYRAPEMRMNGFYQRLMTKDDPEHPPLISFYRDDQ